MQAFPTYVITSIPLQEIQLRSGKVLDRQRPSIVIQEEEEEETTQLNSHPRRRRRRNHPTTHG
jgi:hypothetical protein